jgi:3-hydroxyisobutyrate dehydrogenase-like beta-hydroxyacid dehydrogenase
MKLGFIGLGRMGTPMVRNLLRAGYSVTVYNRSREKADGLPDATVAGSPAAAAAASDVIITMLADDAAVEEVAQGILSTLPAGAIHVSASTISTRLARQLAGVHASRDQRYLSCPVFGRPEAAEAKKLLVIAGGQPELIDRCRPIFDAIGRQTFVAGPEPWQANALKLCGNFMISSMIETFGEANATLRKADVDPHLFLEVMNALFASPVYANYGRIIADEAFEPAGFALRLGLKDVRLILETATECQSPMPIASLIRDQLVSAMANGQAEQDWSSVVRSAARNAGLSSGR